MKAGDLVYFVMPAADAEKAKSFYGSLFGWDFTPGTVPTGFNIENSTPPGGLHGGGEATTPDVYFNVDDIDKAVAQIRELGGSATDPEPAGGGRMSHCKDDQGTTFNIWSAADS